MAINMDKIKQRLASLDKSKKNGNKKPPTEQQERIKKYIWKPESGKQVVRMVPYQFCPDDPFIELKFYYDFLGDRQNHLSPASINKPDPIFELATRLQKTKDKDTWVRGKRLENELKLRTYVPIIVRGKEEEGVKFWGFGKQVYEQLISIVNEPEYGDITDFLKGYDIQVTFKTKEEVQKDFPETTILIKPSPRPVIDPEHPKAKEILDLITKKQVNILDVYTLASYDELASMLDIRLENERSGGVVESRGADRTSPKVTEEVNDTVVLPTEEEIEEATSGVVAVAEVVAPATPPVSPSAQKAKKATADDFKAAFENIFAASKK